MEKKKNKIAYLRDEHRKFLISIIVNELFVS